MKIIKKIFKNRLMTMKLVAKSLVEASDDQKATQKPSDPKWHFARTILDYRHRYEIVYLSILYLF